MKRQLMCGSSATATVERFMPLEGLAPATATTHALGRVMMAAAGTLRNAEVKLSAAPGAGKSWVVTYVKNGTDTALEVTVADTDTTGSNTTDEVTFVAGDTISVRYTPINSPTATTLRHACEVEADSALACGGLGSGPGPFSTPQYRSPFIVGSGGAEALHHTRLPCGIEVNAIYIELTAAVPSGGTFHVQLRKDGADVAGASFDISEGNTTGSVTGRTDAFAEDDDISIELAVSNYGFSAAPTVALGMAYTPDVDGESVLAMVSTQMSNTDVNYNTTSGVSTWVTANTVRRVLSGGAWTLRARRAELTTAPGVGASRTFRSMDADTALDGEITISGTDTVGSTATEVSVTSGMLLNLRTTPADSPATAGNNRWSGVMFIEPEAAAAGAPGKVMMVG